MYNVNENDPSSLRRKPFGPELVVGCKTCGRAKGVACIIAKFSDREDADFEENTEVPHDRRYRAAKIDPYAPGALAP